MIQNHVFCDYAPNLAVSLVNFTHATKTSMENKTLTNKDALLLLLFVAGPQPVKMKTLVEAMNIWRHGKIELKISETREWANPKYKIRQRTIYVHDFDEMFKKSQFMGGHVGSDTSSTMTRMRNRKQIVPTYWYRSFLGHYAITDLGLERLGQISDAVCNAMIAYGSKLIG